MRLRGPIVALSAALGLLTIPAAPAAAVSDTDHCDDDAVAYSAKVGVTTNVDMGDFVIPGTPHAEGSFEIDTLANWDPFTAYDALLALHQENRPALPHHCRQRHSHRGRVRFRADLDPRSVAHALLHGDRQERAGRARKWRADARPSRGATALYGSQPVVLLQINRESLQIGPGSG
jgi:hypothetical protein